MIAQLNHMAHIWWQWMGGMFWQVGLLIILVTIIDRVIRSWAWPQVRYVLWGLVFLKLVIPPTWQMDTSVVAWVQPMFEKHISIQVEPDDKLTGAQLATDLTLLSGETSDESAVAGQATWQSGLFLAWLGGMAAFATALFRKLSRLRKWQHRQNNSNAADSEIPDWFHELLAETAGRLKLKKAPAVVFSKEAASPAVFGIVRPTILLPEGYLGGLSREEAEHVLIHELCHLKRGDLLIHWLCLLIQIFYWFNPLLIWTRRQMRHVCEICCDLSVADILREKTRSYRETLLKNARELFTETVEPSLGLLGLFEEPFRIVPRLRWLEKETWGHRKKKLATALATSLIMIVFVMPMAGLSQSNEQQPEYKGLYMAATYPSEVSEEANTALVEAQGRFEANREDLAAAREPLIDYVKTHSSASVPLTMYQMLAQFWYIDDKNENRIEEANQVYATAFAMYPENDQLLLNYAVSTYELGRLEDAAVLFERYYQLNENHEIKYLEYAAQAYYTAEELDEAKRVYSELIDSVEPPEEKWFDIIIGLCLQTGDSEGAGYYIQQATDYYPSESKYKRLSASASFGQGDNENGAAMLEETGLAVPSEPKTRTETDNQTGKVPNKDGVYELDEVDTPPAVQEAFPPVYPLEAKEKNITGQVMVEFTVTREGVSRDEGIIEAEPPGVFEEAALEAVRQYRFSPGTINGEAVDVRVELPIKFSLGGPNSQTYQPDTEPSQIPDQMFIPPLPSAEPDSPPRLIKDFPPQYPYDAKKDKVEGWVLLRFVVDIDGKAKEPEVVEAEPEGVFEQSALDAILQAEFEPATKNGTPVLCIGEARIEYNLDPGDKVRFRFSLTTTFVDHD